MTVGVGHRSLEAATPEEDFATVLKEADGAFLANQNFHDVEARMTRTPDLANPGAGGPAQSPLFPSIHRPIPFPALVGMAGPRASHTGAISAAPMKARSTVAV